MKKKKHVIALEAKAKTVGDWLKIKRPAKNLTPGHVAEKMGIAASVILAWEGGISTPNEQQWQTLSNLLSFDVNAYAKNETIDRVVCWDLHIFVLQATAFCVRVAPV